MDETKTKVAVRITRAFLPYVAGEVAWFDELRAASLIKQGFAEPAPDVGPYLGPEPVKALQL